MVVVFVGSFVVCWLGLCDVCLVVVFCFVYFVVGLVIGN